MVGVPMNTLCKFGGSELATQPWNYTCVALLVQPGKIHTTGSLQENFQKDYIK
jgi:hypothetical protein